MAGNEPDLHTAIKRRDSQVIATLIQNGVNLKERNEEGMNSLHVAVAGSSYEVVQMLLNADPTLIDDVVFLDDEEFKQARWYGYTALHLSARRKNIEITRLLLRSNAEVDVVARNLRRPLHEAAFHGNLNCVKLLLENGAQIDVLDGHDKTAMMLATQQNHLPVVDHFVHNGMVITDHSLLIRLLELAVINLSLPLVNHLLETYEINVNERLKYGRTFIHLCILPNNLISDRHVADNLKKDRICEHEHVAKSEIVSRFLRANTNVKAVCNEGLTGLHLACALGYFYVAGIIINAYLRSGFPEYTKDTMKAEIELIDFKANNGKTPLMYAVECGDADIVYSLLTVDADVEIRNAEGETILEIASAKSEIQIVGIILEKYRRLNQYENHFIIALQTAIKHERVYLIDGLISSANITLEPVRGKMIAVVNMINKTSIEVSRFLLSLGHNVRFTQPEQALHIAIANNYNDIIKNCLHEGVNMNHTSTEGNSILYKMCAKGNLDAAKKCIAFGGDVNLRNFSGCTALHAAVRTVNGELILLLIDSGGDINVKNNETETPFIVFVKNLSSWYKNNNHLCLDVFESKLRNIMRITNMLIRPGSNLNCNETNISCVLHLAVKTGILDLVKIIIQHHPVLNHLDKDNGQTCLHIAAEFNYVNIMKILLEFGANPDVLDKDNELPITIAIKKGHEDMVKLLVKFSNFNAYRDSNMRTVMHLAAISGNKEIISDLVYAGAPLHVLDNDHKTPLCFAAAKKCGNTFIHFFLMGFDLNTLTHSSCSGYSFCTMFLSTYILKLFLARCNLKEIFVALITTLLEDGRCKVLTRVYKDVKLEAAQLNETIIPGTTIPFVDILKLDDRKLANYARNHRLTKVFENVNHLQIRWPHYWRLLIANITRGYVRKRLLDKCIAIFTSGVFTQNKPKLPQCCVSLILDNLENNELHTFLVSFPFVDTSEYDKPWFIY